ncbi:MAG TPA: gamma-glutamyltransferase family protein [Steroidobacteraceae bacterium]|jgi:gamma-glutamyltranspeptidase/glutathione hydrolase|nr:gamma-glutamyltransferase family protein [Steroidobacteraceae bacterium]
MNFNWNTGYPSVRLPLFARNVVSTSHPLAAQAGLALLKMGGNAVDAAIGAAAAMTVLEPCSNGLGSDAFCMLWDGTQLHGLNASGPAPAAWTVEYFRKRYGESARQPPMRGWDSVTVPGAVAAWVALSNRFGKLAFADLLAPAIEIAERGYAVPVVVQQKWAAAVPELAPLPGFAASFMPEGRAPHVGERFVFAAAARALKAIAETRGAALYGGEIAAAAAAHAAGHGGSMRVADFAAFSPEWVQPIGMDVNGYRLHQIPPNGQGIAALIALGILEHLHLAAHAVDGAASQHLQIEAMKLAFADTYAHVADPVGMRRSVEEMLDPAYLKNRAALIDPDRAQIFGEGHAAKGGTIYLAAADESGMMVSFIQSNYMGFGSGVVVPEWGLSLQNRGHAFSLDSASPNRVAPGKRPFHTIIPGFLTRDGLPQMSFGVMGANMQPQGHVQTLVRMLVHGQQPQAACDAPRWRFNQGLSINVEASMPAATLRELANLGHRIEVIEDSYQDFGAGQFIWRLGSPAVDGYVAASDSRRDGQAAGY